MPSPTRYFTYDTLEVGEHFVSAARTITEADHGVFTLLGGSLHPIHCDDEYAKTTPMGRRVVPGVFGITLALGSLQKGLMESTSDRAISGLGLKDWLYKAPLFIGDTVHVELEIVGKRATSRGRYIVERLFRLINQNGVIVQQGRADSLWEMGARAS